MEVVVRAGTLNRTLKKAEALVDGLADRAERADWLCQIRLEASYG